jgi:hypothetical protein
MTDYRALCAELVDAIGSLVGGVKCGHYQQQDMWKCREIFDRAHAALAQPAPVAPVAPTDEELYELWEESGFESDRFARAVLSKWGNQ